MRLVALAVLALVATLVAGYNRARFNHPAARAMPPTLLAEADKIVHHHSVFPPHLSQHSIGNPNLAHWSFGLSAVVTDDFVRLTANKASREGYLWNDVAVQLESWTAHIGFRVHSMSNRLGGDGFAMWISERPYTHGGPVLATPAGGFLGVGIVFDTFDNDGQRDNPSVHVLAELEKPTHAGDLDPRTDFKDGRLATCSFDFRNTQAADIVHAVIKYDGAFEKLSVVLESSSRSLLCAEVTGIHIPAGYYFGLTAHTGQVADNHDVHWFVVTSDEPPQQQQGTSDAAGANDVEGVDARIAALEERARPTFDHNKEREEKQRWKAA